MRMFFYLLLTLLLFQELTYCQKIIPCINDKLNKKESVDLCNLNGEYQFSFTAFRNLYTYINKFSDNFIPVERENRWGVIQRQKIEDQYYKCIGKCPEISIEENYSIAISFDYDYISECTSKYCIAVKNGKWGIISIESKKVIDFKYDYLEFSDDLILAKNNKNYGFIDINEEIKIPFKYSYAKSFSQNLALVYNLGKCGYIDKAGKVIIPLIYDKCFSFSEENAVVKKGKMYYYINKSNKKIFQKDFQEANPFYDGVATVKENGKWYLIDLSFKKIREIEADEIYPFSSGFARFKKNSKYGFINTKGEILYNSIFDEASDFEFYLAKAKINEKNILIDTFGKKVLTDFDKFTFTEFGKNIIVVKNNKKGLIDEKYNEIFKPEFDDIKPISERYFILKRNNKWLFATNDGKILPQEYDSIKIEEFKKPAELAEVCIDGKCALFNVNALSLITAFDFDELNIFEDRIIFKKNSKLGYMSRDGKILMPAEYDGIEQIEGNAVAVKKNGKMGVFDLTQGRETIPPTYKSIFIILNTIEAKTPEEKKLCFNLQDYKQKKCPY